MSLELNFRFFVYFVLPPVIFIIGMFGNLMSLIVLSRDKVKKIGPIVIYRFLHIMDSVYLIFIITKYLQFSFDISVDDISSYWCKINRYFYYSLDAISPMMIAYIAIERYVCIKYTTRRFFMRKKKVQFLFFVIIFTFNALYYIPIPIFQDLIEHFYQINESISNQTIVMNNNSLYFCDFITAESQFYLSWADFLNLIIIPFLLMTTFTLLLIHAIFTSRRRVIFGYTSRENRAFQRDVKFAVTSISLNLIYLILNLPLALISFTTSFNDYTFLLCVYVFFASYGVNFYIVLFSNSLFREEFISIFRLRVYSNHNTSNHSGDINNNNMSKM